MAQSEAYLFIEYAGGPHDGQVEPFLEIRAEDLYEYFDEARDYDPLFGTPFANAPGPLSDMLLVTEHNNTKYFYAFKSQWRTRDGRRLRVEHIAGNPELENLGEGELV